MGRFSPTGPIEERGLEHSVATLSWGVLSGARGPSDGSAGAASNVPSALGVVRHPAIYAGIPSEIEEAFLVLERHVMCDGRLYPVALAATPFLFDTLRRGNALSGRLAMLVARYAVLSPTLDRALGERLLGMFADQAGEIIRWFGRDASHDLAVGALAITIPSLRDVYIAAVEGAERLSPETLVALAQLGEAPGDSVGLALEMLDGPDASDLTRMCAAAFLARLPSQPADLRARIDAALPPTAITTLRRHTQDLWIPTLVRPNVAPRMYDAQVVFTGKKVLVVRAGDRSVTLPWTDAMLGAGDRLQVGLTTHGEPKLALVTDRTGKVRVIDFDAALPVG